MCVYWNAFFAYTHGTNQLKVYVMQVSILFIILYNTYLSRKDGANGCKNFYRKPFYNVNKLNKVPEIVEGDYVRVLFYTVNLLIYVINYASQGPLKTYEHHSSLGRQELWWMKKWCISPEKNCCS